MLCKQQLAIFKILPTTVLTLFCFVSGAVSEQTCITGPQTGRDSLTDLPPPKSSSSMPAAIHSASPHLASQMNLSHGLSPPNLDQLPSELPLKQSVTHPPAVTHPPTACAQELPANAIASRSSSKLPSQLPSQLPPATEAPACCDSDKQVQEWHDLHKQKADALMAQILSNRTGDHSGKNLTPKELAEFQSQLLEQGREEVKRLPGRLDPAKPPPRPTGPPPPKQAAHHLPNPLQLQLPLVNFLQPYACRDPPERLSSIAQALQRVSKGLVNPVAVHAAAVLHARGAKILYRRKTESVDAAVLSVVLKECQAKPTNKQYTDALLEATDITMSGSTVSSGARMLSDDLTFTSALSDELSRLTQPKSTAKDISSSTATVSKPGRMPSSKCTKRPREDDPIDLSLESAHMGPHMTSPGQEATNVNTAAADVELPRPEKKKMCFGVGQPSSGAVSRVGDSSKHVGDCTTVCGDLANNVAMIGSVPFNSTSGDYIYSTLNFSSVFLAVLLSPCLAWSNA